MIGIVLAIFLTGCSESGSVPTEQQKVLDPTQEAASEKQKALDKERGIRAVLGASSILASARNPDSVKFDSVIILADGTTCYAYRAQNGFGGMNREHAVLLLNGKNLSTSAASWNAHCANKQGTDVTYNVAMLAGHVH